MMPYWYSQFAKYHFERTPPFRAMNLGEGFTSEIISALNSSLEENPYEIAAAKEIKDRYIAGEYLLVAPMFTGKVTDAVKDKPNTIAKITFKFMTVAAK